MRDIAQPLPVAGTCRASAACVDALEMARVAAARAAAGVQRAEREAEAAAGQAVRTAPRAAAAVGAAAATGATPSHNAGATPSQLLPPCLAALVAGGLVASPAVALLFPACPAAWGHRQRTRPPCIVRA